MARPTTTITGVELSSLSIICFFAVLPLCHSAGCHPNDRAALIDINTQLKNVFTDDLWNPNLGCCRWFGVGCDDTQTRVVEFVVAGNQPDISEFAGPIPDAIGRLTYLENLVIKPLTSKMSGTIPSSLQALTHLRSLTITQTNVSGPIPDWIGRFKNLTSLDLSFNRFTGPIPPSFGRFPRTVQSLNLANNRLTSVPQSMGHGDFVEIWLQKNALQGDVSFLLKNRTGSLKYIELSSNHLAFDLSRVVFPLKLQYINLASNKIYGRIPPGIVGLSDLSTLDLSNNRLCGRIPRGGPMKRFAASAYKGNKCLCGPPLSKKC